MSRRYHTTGCGTPHVIAPGYRYQSDPNARFVRPAGEPSLLVGLAVLILIAVAAWLAIVALSPASDATAPASSHPTRVGVEAAGTSSQGHTR